ncbi:MAG: hypothetical protein LBV06_08610 [Propionibacteriaceae bacterium]|jgi:hypothetical protein|nr:hypothetical protein [Propionibacteriaceae bacterium]
MTDPEPVSDKPWSYHTFILPFVAQVPNGVSIDTPDLVPAVFVSTPEVGRQPAEATDPSSQAEPFHKIPLNPTHWIPTSWLQDQPPTRLTHAPSGDGATGETATRSNHDVGSAQTTPPTDPTANSCVPSCPTPLDELFDTYNTFQFFTEAARDLAFGRKPQGDPQLVRHFDLRPNGEPLRDCHYVIDWTEQASRVEPDRPPRHHRYDLDLVRIRLITYNTFVSILVLETEYRSPDHHEVDDILRINEYGRRICYPYLHHDLVRTLADDCPHGHPRVADSIAISGLTPPDVPVRADFVFQSGTESWTEQLEFQYVMEPLKLILTRWTDGYEATSSVPQAVNDTSGKTGFVVQPVMDSRMFTCCLYRDEAFAQAATAQGEDGLYAVTSPRASDDEVANAFYCFAFVDTGRPTCQNRRLRSERLKASVYDRWGDDQVLHAVTDRSFVALINESNPALDFAVVRAFRTMYLEMVIFALAQKASIMQMSHRAADLADRFDKVGVAGWTESSLIAILERKNALMQNQVILSEVTTMVQGREIFDIMRAQLGLTRCNTELIAQLEYLYRMDAARAQARQRVRDSRTSWSLNALALGLGLLAIPSTLMSWVTTDNQWARIVGGVSFIVFFVIFGVTLLALSRRGRHATPEHRPMRRSDRIRLLLRRRRLD